MNISHKKIDDVNANITVELAPEDYNPNVDKAIKEQAKKANLPGFRPGKVPAGHIRRTYGKAILFDEVNRLVNEKISAYISEQKLDVLGQPLPAESEADDSYAWDFNDTFNFTYDIGLAPEFDVPFGADTEFVEYDIQADEATLAERIANLRRSYGKMTSPDIAEEGDILYVELKQEKEEGWTKTVSLQTRLVKDAKTKKALVGLKADDTVKIDLKKSFEPEDAARLINVTPEMFGNMDVTKCELTVKSISRMEEAELNQEFFDKLFPEGDVTTEEQFNARVKEEFESVFKQDAAQKLRNDMYTFGMDKVDAKFPEDFLKRWLKATNPELKEEEVEEGFADFLSNLKWTIIENRVLTNNDLEVKYDEVIDLAKNRIAAQMRMYNVNDTLDDDQLQQYAMQLLSNREQANRLFEEAKALKVFDHLASTVKIKSKKIDYDKFVKLDK